VDSAPQPAPSAKPEQPKADKPTPKRTRRAGGIPADIIAMMTEIFGEGVTYSSEPPEDEQLEDSLDDVVDAGDAYKEQPGEGEFADEPVDDADFDEEDD
jgi:hypothetical protein